MIKAKGSGMKAIGFHECRQGLHTRRVRHIC